MKSIGALVALLVMLMPGALALEYAYSFGNGASETLGSYVIEGAATVFLTGNAVEPAASNHLFARGSISTSRSANSGNGLAHATSYFSVTGPSAKTIYEFTSSATTYSAQTTESLTSYDADTIYASGEGWNSNGDDAWTRITVSSPTDDKAALLDYRNNAYAYKGSSSYAQVTQGCAWADVRDYSKGYILTELNAKEGGGDYSHVMLRLPYGTINTYPSSPYNNAIAYASRTANSGNGMTYAYQSTNAYAMASNSGGHYYFAKSDAKPVGYSLKQDIDYYATGTHTLSQYASTTYPNSNAYNTHNV